MQRRIINPWTWQQSLGFVWANEITHPHRTIYLAGHASVDGQGQPLYPGDMQAQVTKTLDNIETVLQASDLMLSDVIRLNFYTVDVDAILACWASAITARLQQAGCQPASTLLGVTRLAFPELLVEIEATAVATVVGSGGGGGGS